VQYTTKKYQLVISLFQAAILCLFNEHDELTCAKIKELTNMPKEVFTASMKAMANPKVKLLLK
jgi:hypothetical protein